MQSFFNIILQISKQSKKYCNLYLLFKIMLFFIKIYFNYYNILDYYKKYNYFFNLFNFIHYVKAK